jgi:DNA-directed RNA polymerase specialized sigma24 family protein
MFTLAQYNREVLACQDEAYTLAWYYLADEAAAEAVVQEAVAMAFATPFHRQQPSIHQSCRLAIFYAVLRQCHLRWRSAMPITGAAAGQAIPTLLHRMPELEMQVLLLIEILGLGSAETAQLLDRPVKEILTLLARARHSAAQLQFSQAAETA